MDTQIGGGILNPAGTVTDWINRENIAMDGHTLKTPDGIYYTSGSKETRLEYEHQTLRTVADVLEWASLGLEVAGAASALPSGGTGTALIFVGEGLGFASTALNVGMDMREGKYFSAGTRTALFILTFGLGKGLDKIATKPVDKTAGVLIKTANDKTLDAARDLEVQRMRQKGAEQQRQIERQKLMRPLD